MLKYKVRAGVNKKIILENNELFKDKVILDISCRTEILSFFAVQAAQNMFIVYGIEFEDIADYS